MGAQHIIELNGKRYDTVTGKLVDTVGTSRASKPSPKAPTPVQATPSKPATPVSQIAPTVSAPLKSLSKPKLGMVDGIKRTRSATKPNNVARRHPQKSQTLMREAARGKSLPAKLPKPAQPEVVTHDHHGMFAVDSNRLQRAKAIPQNKFIGRFTAAKSPTVPASLQASATPAVAAPTTPPSFQPAVPAPAARPFDSAIAQATSHAQPKQPKKRAHRVARTLHVKPATLKTISAVLVVGLIGSFIAYQQTPSIHMKLASSRSGVAGILPTYTPAGYKLSNDIDYKPGEITLNFRSNSDQRGFTVVQSQSFWTSESLRQNFIAPLHTTYQTIEENGKTIYLYGNNATWVDGGTWYKVQAKDAQLSSAQLTNLIKSL